MNVNQFYTTRYNHFFFIQMIKSSRFGDINFYIDRQSNLEIKFEKILTIENKQKKMRKTYLYKKENKEKQ